MRKFHGTKVLGLFGMGANVPWNESSTGAKVLSMVFSLPGTKVQRNEKAWNPAGRAKDKSRGTATG